MVVVVATQHVHVAIFTVLFVALARMRTAQRKCGGATHVHSEVLQSGKYFFSLLVSAMTKSYPLPPSTWKGWRALLLMLTTPLLCKLTTALVATVSILLSDEVNGKGQEGEHYW